MSQDEQEMDKGRVVTLMELQLILRDKMPRWFFEKEGLERKIMKEAYVRSFKCEKKIERTVKVGPITVY
jgi:hypothetical protein